MGGTSKTRWLTEQIWRVRIPCGLIAMPKRRRCVRVIGWYKVCYTVYTGNSAPLHEKSACFQRTFLCKGSHKHGSSFSHTMPRYLLGVYACMYGDAPIERGTIAMTSRLHKGQIIVAVLGFAGVVSTEQGARRGENLKVRVLSTR